MTTTTPLLEVKGLKAGYGRAEVLHGLSLQAAPRSVITVIGPNGAGKSTLLNALMGVLPAKGQVFYKGEDISRLTLEDRVMLGIALVPADGFPDLMPEVEGLLPEFLHANAVYPLRLQDGQLDVAMAVPQDAFVVKALHLATGYAIRPHLALESDIEKALASQ